MKIKIVITLVPLIIVILIVRFVSGAGSTPPALTNPFPNSSQNSRNFNVNITTNETSTCRYSFSNISYDQMGSSMTEYAANRHGAVATVPADGNYTVYFACRDDGGNDGNNNTIVFEAVAAVTEPTVLSFAYPSNADNAFVNRNWTYINVTLSKNASAIHTFIISFNGTNYTNANLTLGTDYFARNYTNLTEGNYTYYAWVNNTVGSSKQSSTRKITIDYTKPNASIIIVGKAPFGFANASQEFTVSRSVTLQLSFNDTNGISVCRFANEDMAFSLWEACFSTKAWILSDGNGNKTLVFETMDNAGNINQTNDTIFLNTTGAGIDLTPPLTPTANDDGAYQNNGQMLHFKWNSSDPQNELLGIPLAYNYRIAYNNYTHFVNTSYINSTWTETNITEITLYRLNLSNATNYTIEVRAINTGKVESDTGLSDGIIVDITPPSIPLVSIAGNGNWSANRNALINWSSNGTISGVEGYSYAIDHNPATAPDDSLEGENDDLLLEPDKNDGNFSIIKYNLTGLNSAVFIEVLSNVTQGHILRITLSLTESHADSSDFMGIRVYAISNAPNAFDMRLNNISTIYEADNDFSHHSELIKSDSYKAEIRITGNVSGVFFLAVSGLTENNNNNYNLLLASSGTSINTSTQSYFCTENLSCINQTNSMDYAIKIESEDVKADGIWDNSFNVGDGISYFHVKAKDQAGNFGSINHSTILVDASPGSTPQIAEPEKFTNTSSISFNWTQSTDPDSGIDNYYLQADNDSDFGSPEFSGFIGNATNYTAAVSADQTYHGRVLSRNLARVNSSWSDSVSTIVDTTAPAILFKKPTDGSTITRALTKLVVNTNEKAICKHGTNQTNFDYTNSTYHETKIISTAGSNSVSFRCVDEINNANVSSFTYTLNTGLSATSVTVPNKAVFTDSLMGADIIVQSGSTRIGEIPKEDFNVSVGNLKIPFSIKDNGNGNYTINFVSPEKNGTYTLGVQAETASGNGILTASNLDFGILYEASGLTAVSKNQLVYGLGTNYSIGLASDSASLKGASSSVLLNLTADGNNGNVYIFFTKRTLDVEKTETLLEEKTFDKLINPSFAFPEQQLFIVFTNLEYRQISVIGDLSVQEGRHSINITNEGFNETGNTTQIKITLS